MPDLKRFWFKFEKLHKPTPLNFGCGVTACDRDDAISLVQRSIFLDAPMPRIVEVIEDVRPSDLEPHHVSPNIGDTEAHGIWFPQGYNKS